MAEDARAQGSTTHHPACAVDGCAKAARKRGYCWSHYSQGKCVADSCDRDARRSGLCWAHYEAALGTCRFDGCGRAGRRNGYCSGHRKQGSRGTRTELQEPRGAARDRAGLPRRTLMDQLEEAAIELANYNSEGDTEGYERARARLRMTSLRHGRASPEQHPHTG